jgi:hypothetical protein
VQIRNDRLVLTESMGTGSAVNKDPEFPADFETCRSCTRESQSPQSGHRPIHLNVWLPQVLHRYISLSLFFTQDSFSLHNLK